MRNRATLPPFLARLLAHIEHLRGLINKVPIKSVHEGNVRYNLYPVKGQRGALPKSLSDLMFMHERRCRHRNDLQCANLCAYKTAARSARLDTKGSRRLVENRNRAI